MVSIVVVGAQFIPELWAWWCWRLWCLRLAYRWSITRPRWWGNGRSLRGNCRLLLSKINTNHFVFRAFIPDAFLCGTGRLIPSQLLKCINTLFIFLRSNFDWYVLGDDRCFLFLNSLLSCFLILLVHWKQGGIAIGNIGCWCWCLIIIKFDFYSFPTTLLSILPIFWIKTAHFFKTNYSKLFFKII